MFLTVTFTDFGFLLLNHLYFYSVTILFCLNRFFAVYSLSAPTPRLTPSPVKLSLS